MGNLTSKVNIHSSSIYVGSDAIIKKAIFVESSIKVMGILASDALILSKGDIDVINDLYCDGPLTCGGNLMIGRDVYCNSNVNAIKDIVAINNARVVGKIDGRASTSILGTIKKTSSINPFKDYHQVGIHPSIHLRDAHEKYKLFSGEQPSGHSQGSFSIDDLMDFLPDVGDNISNENNIDTNDHMDSENNADNQIDEDDDIEHPPVLNAMVFSQNFHYSIIQLIIGKKITTKNKNISANSLKQSFDRYSANFSSEDKYMVPKSKQPSFTTTPSLSDLAINSATILKNNIVEHFEDRRLKFIKFLIKEKDKEMVADDVHSISVYIYSLISGTEKQDWPEKITKTIEMENIVQDIIEKHRFGPKPLNTKSISSKPHVYIKTLYNILKYYEGYNELERAVAEGVQSEATLKWAKYTITHMPNQKIKGKVRKKASIQLADFCNKSDLEIKFTSTKLKVDAKEYLKGIAIETRKQIEKSKLFLGGDLSIDPSECFQPHYFLVSEFQKLFSLLSEYGFIQKHVQLNYTTLKSLLSYCDLLPESSKKDSFKGVNKFINNARLFFEIFNFKKVKLQQCLRSWEQFFEPNIHHSTFVFSNILYSDGHSISFLIEKKGYPTKLPDLDGNDLQDHRLYDKIKL
ncbi:unnamed protein product [Cunninghamella blakesleeana]